MMTPPKIISVSLPQYTIDSKPDYITLGKTVDKHIEANFPDGWYYERVLSMDDHSNLDIDEFVNIIIATGTDRYDPSRKSVCHNQFEIYDYDLHLGSFEIKNGLIQTYEDEQPTLFGEAIYNFYEHAPLDRGKSLRIDLMILFDPNAFEVAKKLEKYSNEPNHRFEKYLYKFKKNFDRSRAVVGVVKILR